MKLIRTNYRRPILTAGGSWLRDELVEISAECEQAGDDVIVIWTDETLARLAELDLTGDELLGCDEAVTEAFWAAGDEEIRLARVAQQTGDRAFFERLNERLAKEVA